MPVIITQRIGAFSRLLMSNESSPGVDGTGGYVLPIRDRVGFQLKQGTVEAPVFNQSLLPYGRVYGQRDASGAVPLGFEFLTSPAIFKLALGAPTKTNMVTGACHDFTIPSGVVTLGTCGLQHEWGETTATFFRSKYCRPKSFALTAAPSGVSPLDVAFVGSGDYSTVDIGGSKTDNGYPAVSAFNGRLSINGIQVVGTPNFKWMMDTGVTPFPVAFNNGIAGSINPGVINVNGSVEVAFATDGSGVENNLYLFNQAIGQGFVSMQALWANNATTGTVTALAEITMPTLRLDAASPVSGGKSGLTVASNYNLVNDVTSGKISAANFGTVPGPYNITASNNVFTVNVDGAGDITVTLGTSATKTVDQIVTELNAAGTFSAKAVADNFANHVRVTSKTTGTTSTVQFHTGVANGSETVLGFTNTSMAGYNSPFLLRYWNAQTTAY